MHRWRHCHCSHMLLLPPRAAATARAVSIDTVACVCVAEEPTVADAFNSRLPSGAHAAHESHTIAEATPTAHRSLVLARAAGTGQSSAAMIAAIGQQQLGSLEPLEGTWSARLCSFATAPHATTRGRGDKDAQHDSLWLNPSSCASCVMSRWALCVGELMWCSPDDAVLHGNELLQDARVPLTVWLCVGRFQMLRADCVNAKMGGSEPQPSLLMHIQTYCVRGSTWGRARGRK